MSAGRLAAAAQAASAAPPRCAGGRSRSDSLRGRRRSRRAALAMMTRKRQHDREHEYDEHHDDREQIRYRHLKKAPVHEVRGMIQVDDCAEHLGPALPCCSDAAKPMMASLSDTTDPSRSPAAGFPQSSDSLIR